MAKKKTQTEEIEVPVTETTEQVEAVTETPQKEEKVTDSKKAENPSGPKKVSKPEDIPDGIKAVLKTFSNYPELLITSHGNVYTPGNKLAISKGAILYKNPFYNS